MSSVSQFVRVVWRDRLVDMEYSWVGTSDVHQPVMVFLHEGLGSVSMWRDFPDQLCTLLNIRGLIYSRPGYGQSTVHPPYYSYTPNFMHEQAHEVLPCLLSKLDISSPVWLFGHSDGASIALLYAAMHPVAGVIVLAPHLFVEVITLSSIVLAKQAYQTTDLRNKLRRHHLNVDATFWTWNRIWLDPAFRRWSIESEVQRIQAPILAIQGEEDEYGTLAQINCLPKWLAQAQTAALPHCKHSPHRDQPKVTMQLCQSFMSGSLPYLNQLRLDHS